MIDQRIREEYSELLESYIMEGDERYLALTEDLARELVLANVPLEDIGEMHEAALKGLARRYPEPISSETVCRTCAPLMEILMVYSLAFRQRLEERKRLEREILRVSESERWQIGRDLHDSLGQQLTGIAFLAKALEQKLAMKGLPEASHAARIIKEVNEAATLTRRLSRGLCPVELEARGLMAALEKLATDAERVFGISCVFECDQTILIHDPAVPMHLYRIAQEALNNAVKHGRAKHVVIRFNSSGDRGTLTVRDDGVGMPKVLDKGKGLGLEIMRYRADMIDGFLEIRRPAGGGTLICVQFRTLGPDKEAKDGQDQGNHAEG